MPLGLGIIMARIVGDDSHHMRTTGGLSIPRPPVLRPDELNRQQMALIEAADGALRSEAYNAVDLLLLGSALRTSDGSIFTGANLRSERAERHMHSEDTAITNAERAGAFKSETDGIPQIATIAKYVDGDHTLPKFLCDKCSERVLIIAAKSGIDTEIILSNTDKSKFFIVTITDMFAYRNIPHGKVEFEADGPVF